MEVAMSAMPAVAPQAGPLRLTSRGRLVVAIAVALLVAVVMLVATATAQATSSPPSRGSQGLAQVVVGPGESLWSVAERADPDQDPRVIIPQIMDLNALTGDVVYAGQRLWVPRGLSRDTPARTINFQPRGAPPRGPPGPPGTHSRQLQARDTPALDNTASGTTRRPVSCPGPPPGFTVTTTSSTYIDVVFP
jgi:LysM repeat protein